MPAIYINRADDICEQTEFNRADNGTAPVVERRLDDVAEHVLAKPVYFGVIRKSLLLQTIFPFIALRRKPEFFLLHDRNPQRASRFMTYGQYSQSSPASGMLPL